MCTPRVHRAKAKAKVDFDEEQTPNMLDVKGGEKSLCLWPILI